MKLKEGLDIHTSDFGYDLIDGGYFDPEKMCEDQGDAKRVKDAIAVIKEFKKACEEQIDGFWL